MTSAARDGRLRVLWLGGFTLVQWEEVGFYWKYTWGKSSVETRQNRQPSFLRIHRNTGGTRLCICLSRVRHQCALASERSRDQKIWRRVRERLPESDHLRAEEGGGAGLEVEVEVEDSAQRSRWTVGKFAFYISLVWTYLISIQVDAGFYIF